LRVLWLCLGYFAVQASYEALVYVLGSPAFFDPLFQEKYIRHLALVRTHGLAAATALIIGLLQFAPESLRFKCHRYLGRVYFLAVAVAAVTALPLALMAEGGRVTRTSFLLLAILWFATLLAALQAARRRRFKIHRSWMIRNYALTYGAVLTRILQNLFLELGYSFEAVYPKTSFSWLVTLAVGEWWIGYSEQLRKDKTE
jgi:uncharacterized membrane protein